MNSFFRFFPQFIIFYFVLVGTSLTSLHAQRTQVIPNFNNWKCTISQFNFPENQESEEIGSFIFDFSISSGWKVTRGIGARVAIFNLEPTTQYYDGLIVVIFNWDEMDANQSPADFVTSGKAESVAMPFNSGYKSSFFSDIYYKKIMRRIECNKENK